MLREGFFLLSFAAKKNKSKLGVIPFLIGIPPFQGHSHRYGYNACIHIYGHSPFKIHSSVEDTKGRSLLIENKRQTIYVGSESILEKNGGYQVFLDCVVGSQNLICIFSEIQNIHTEIP